MNDAAAHHTPPFSARPAPAVPLGVSAELDRLLSTSGDGSLPRVLQRVATTARHLVPELAEVSVTLVEDGVAQTVGSAGVLAAFLDERQYELGFGPCLDAAVVGSTVVVDTGDPANAYPAFSEVAARHGVTQVLAVGLPIAQRTVGSLNLYTASSRPVAAAAVALAETFAGYAAVAVADAAVLRAAVEEAHHLHEAVRARATIERATGVLMATRRCSAEEALVLLTRASQNQNRRLCDVALDVVDRGLATQK